MKRLLLFLVLFLSLTISNLHTQAQSKETELRGKVLDDMGAPLAGASVLVAGTHRGVQTNASGNFTLTVPADGRHA